ncbi:MAG TPA: hypothetical protein VLI90_10880, partial [Tepidisphaeraceae bacterium]|nr:hypothetical protein [Tepidisphaeraceae bacterium]
AFRYNVNARFPFWNYICKDAGLAYSVENTTNIGRLYSTGYMKSGQVAYCPANLTDPDFGYESFPKPWLQDTTSIYRSSYAYNTYCNLQSGGTAPNQNRLPAFPKLLTFPKTRILAHDTIDTSGNVMHLGRKKYPSWNCLFKDGHVVNVISPILYAQYNNPAQTAVGKTVNKSYDGYDLLLDILETQASGFNLKTTQLTLRVVHSVGETNGGTTRYHPQ